MSVTEVASSAELRQRLRRVWRVRLTGIKVVTNPRLRNTFARYRPGTRRLEVSAAAARSRNLQRILVHELAHAAAVELHGRRVRPHGKDWKALVAAAERAGLTTAGRGTRRKPVKPITARYTHTCPVCQFSKTAKRRVTTWRCPDCLANGLPGLLAIERRR